MLGAGRCGAKIASFLVAVTVALGLTPAFTGTAGAASCVTNVSRPGVVTSSTSWSLRSSLTTGGPTIGPFTYGTRPPALVPLTGDWDGNGTETPGVFQSGSFKLSNTITAEPNPAITLTFGDARGFPVSGDSDGNCYDDLAVYRAGVWQIRYLGPGAPTDRTFNFGFGTWPNTIPVAGDWDGDGIDGIGTFTYATGEWNLRNTATAGPADAGTFIYMAGTGSYPVVGDWDGDGVDGIGVKDSTTTWSLRNTATSGDPEITFKFGAANDLPLSWKPPLPPVEEGDVVICVYGYAEHTVSQEIADELVAKGVAEYGPCPPTS